MKASELYQTGDIIFVSGTSWFSKAIKFFTFGKVNHVAIVYDTDSIYETDGAWRKSKLSPITKYDDSNIRVFRINGLSYSQRIDIRRACDERLGTPYSYWDCFLQGITFAFHPKIQGWIASGLGNSLFTKCDEEVKAVLYKGTGSALFYDSESGDPESFLELCESRQDIFERLPG